MFGNDQPAQPMRTMPAGTDFFFGTSNSVYGTIFRPHGSLVTAIKGPFAIAGGAVQPAGAERPASRAGGDPKGGARKLLYVR